MKSVFWLNLSLMFLVFSCKTESSKNNAGKEPVKPNIIYILADDLGYGDIGCYGQQYIETPHLDRLASEGMLFTQHYAGSTVCAPSRSSLMTGLHTGHTYIRGNKEVQPEGQHPLKAHAVTIAEILKEAGYVTGAMGKWGLGAPGSEGVPEKQGFDYFFGYNCQREAHHYYPDHLWRNDEKIILEENRNGNKGIYSHDLIEEEAIRFIKRNRDTTFFLYLPFTIPHADIDVPEIWMEPYLGKFEEEPFPGDHYLPQPAPKAAFAGMVSRLDASVGKINELVEELNLSKNTIIMFTSDNGPHLEGGAKPDFFNSAGGFKGHKRDLYEGGIRVPFIVKWDGVVRQGATNDHISAFWDMLPTFCELAVADIPIETDGISMVSTLKGQDNQQSHPYLYWEFHEQGGKQAVRKGNWKAVMLNMFENPEGPIELYNLDIDKKEENNVAAAHPEIVKDMREIMKNAHKESDVFPFFNR